MKKLKKKWKGKDSKLSVTEDGKEGKSKCCREEGVTVADSVETLGVDLRTRVERGWEQKNKREERSAQLDSRLSRRIKHFKKSYMNLSVKKLLRAGMVPARTWGLQAVDMARTERLEVEERMAAAAGQKSTTSCPCSWKNMASK